MANNSLGLPRIDISFSTSASTAVFRSSRGKVALILNEEGLTDEDGVVYFKLSDSSELPVQGLSSANSELVYLALAGNPSEVHIFAIPPATYTEEREVQTSEEVATTEQIESTTTVMSDVEVESEVVVTDPDTNETSTVTSNVTVNSEVTVPTTVAVETTTIVTGTTTSTVTVTATTTSLVALKQIAPLKINYIAHPTGSYEDQKALASFAAAQRKNKKKTFKAVVANHAADSYSVINLTTGGIKIVNPDWTSAYEAAGGDETLIPEEVPHYKTYTANQYTARIAGIAAGISLARSMTYYTLPEVVSVNPHEDPDAAIDAGELILIDEKDGLGIKIGRGVNSYVNFTATEGEDLRFIKIVEGIDLIKEDIEANFRANYIGKVVNDYTNKKLLCTAINSYLADLVGSVLDGTGGDSTNYVEIDPVGNRRYLAAHGKDVSSMGDSEIIQANTGVQVFLRGRLAMLNAMEDLFVDFAL